MTDHSRGAHLSNRLLAAIPEAALAKLSSRLRIDHFKQGAIVQEVGEPIEQIYFPQDVMISLIVVTEDGVGIEAATIGYEGAVGLHGGLGRRRAFTRAIVQISGTFSFIAAEDFARVVSEDPAIKDIITQYTEVLWVEAQQVAACNTLHSAEARLARWLLQTQDRVRSDTILLTQEFLSQMLGVRRTTVTLVARAFQKAGLIRYTRGHIVVLDRQGLEEAACECYRIIQHETLPKTIGVQLGPE